MEKITFIKETTVPGVIYETITFQSGEKAWISKEEGGWSIFNNPLDDVPIAFLSSYKLRQLGIEWTENSILRTLL